MIGLSSNSIAQAVKEIDKTPLLRIDPEGPTSFVTCLEFDRQGNLYAGGWDKVVRIWRPTNGGRFRLDRAKTIRIPIGPGLEAGVVNAIAISPDGKTIAIAGSAVFRGTPGFRNPGWIAPSLGHMTDAMQLDQGTIYLFDLQTRTVRNLRGHRGPVIAMEFAPGSNGPQLLVSAATEPTTQAGSDKDNQGVLRLWDTQAGKYVGGTILKDADNQSRPQLSVRRSRNSVEVSTAWSDRNIRIWKPMEKRLLSVPDGPYNKTIAELPDGRALLTGTYAGMSNNDTSARLRRWTRLPNGSFSRAGNDILFQERNGKRYLIQAIAVFPAASGRSLVAVGTQAWRIRDGEVVAEEAELQMVDLQRRRVLGKTELWRSPQIRVPSLAISPDGKFIAASGGPDQEVRVFRTADMLRGNYAAQRLRSNASQVVSAKFVRRGDRRGIQIREAGSQQPMVLDFSAREIKNDAGWQVDEPVSSMHPEEKLGQPLSVVVRTANGEEREVALPMQQTQIGATAVLPKDETSGRSRDIIAIASDDQGQPMLALYDVASGEQFRRFTGHTERIQSLAFSQDGRLLVSTGEDRTIRVWSLVDIATILGQHGRVPGLTLVTVDGKVVVHSVEDNSPVRSKLQEKDALLGVVKSDGLLPLKSAQEYYGGWWHRKPNTDITIRRQRGADTADVTFTVGQGIDERKPLFNIFVARPIPNRPRPWIGWSPMGPFDSSDQLIEQYLGWHFNTGNVNRPTEFADLNQYRDQYYRQGLLSELYRDGVLSLRKPQPPREPPRMAIWIPELGDDPQADGDELIVRSLESVTLMLDLDADYPLQLIDSIECFFDGDSVGSMTLAPEGNWSADLSELDWGRNRHEVSVSLRTSESRPRSFSKRIRARYQPAAPNIELGSKAVAIVDDETFPVTASVTPMNPSEPFVVTLNSIKDGKTTELNRWESEGELNVDETIRLEQGANHLQLVARNANVDVSRSRYETTAKSLRITRSEKTDVPATIVLGLQEPRTNGVVLEFGQSLPTKYSELALRGRITAKEELQSASIKIGEKTNALTGFDSRRDKRTFRIRENIRELEPGSTRVEVTARTASGVDSHFHFEVNYNPPYPEVDFVTGPDAGDRVVVITDATAYFKLEALLESPIGNPIPQRLLKQLDVQLVVDSNGAESTLPAKISADGSELRADVPVGLGANKVALRMSFPWDATVPSTGDALIVTGVPPVEVTVEDSWVQTHDDLQPQLTILAKSNHPVSEIRIGDDLLSPDDWSVDDESGSISIQRRVDPQQPATEVAIHFPRLPPKTIKIPKPRRIARNVVPPEVQFVSPARDTRVQSQLLQIEYTATAREFDFIELRHNRKAIETRTNFDKTNAGLATVTGKKLVELTPDENQFEIIVRNEGGEAKAKKLVTFLAPPVRAIIDGIRPTPLIGKPTGDKRLVKLVPNIARNAESLNLKAQSVASTPLMSVYGRVIWRYEDDTKLKSKLRAKVWVNGFQQTQVLLGPANKKLERPFEIPLLLSATSNLVEVDLPDLQHNTSDDLRFAVDCAGALPGSRMHLLIVGVGGGVDKRKLETDVLDVLSATRTRQNSATFRTPVFAKGWIYGPLTGKSIRVQRVFKQLGHVRRRIANENKASRHQSPSNDVVVIYYTGGELIYEDEQFYLTTRENQTPASLRYDAISSGYLSNFVETTRGAHLLLLDVSRRNAEGVTTSRGWPDTSHGAMLRYAWLNPANVPDQARLLTALVDIQPEDKSLELIDQRLNSRRAQINQQSNDQNVLMYDGRVPESLKSFQLR